MKGLTEQEENTLNDLSYLVANEQFYRDNWTKEGTADKLFSHLDEAIDLINDLKDRLL